MHKFRATKDGVFLDDLMIQSCLGYRVIADAGELPEVVLRIACDEVNVEETDKV